LALDSTVSTVIETPKAAKATTMLSVKRSSLKRIFGQFVIDETRETR